MAGGWCYLPPPSLQGCQFRHQAKQALGGAESLKEGNDGHGRDCCVMEMTQLLCQPLGTARDGGETQPRPGTCLPEDAAVLCGKAEGPATVPGIGCLKEGTQDPASSDGVITLRLGEGLHDHAHLGDTE